MFEDFPKYLNRKIIRKTSNRNELEFYLPSDYMCNSMSLGTKNLKRPNDINDINSKFIPTVKVFKNPKITLWIDANSLNLNDSESVITWPTLVGNISGINTTAVYPTYKLNALNSHATVNFLTTSRMNFTKDFSKPFFITYVSKTIGTAGRVLSGLTNEWFMGYELGFRNQSYFGGYVARYPQPIVDDQWHIYSGYITDTSTVYEDGRLMGRNMDGVSVPTGGLLLNGNISNAQRSTFEIAELMVVESKLTDDQIYQYHLYLTNKYNITLRI